jgi:hypothetical protein
MDDADQGVQGASIPGKLGQSYGLSAWPAGRPIAKRTLTYEGRKYRLRIYGKGPHGSRRRYVAMAKVDDRLIQGALATDESRAQAEFIKLIDPTVEVVNGRRLA